LFFAISGYLIGGHINSEVTSGVFRFANFYRNRAKRILPALYVVLTAVLGIGLVLLSPRELRDLAKYTISTTTSASNILLWRTTEYFGARADHNPLLMTWSLGVEEQFYLVIPVLLVLVARIRRRMSFSAVVLVSVLSFCVAIHQVHYSPDSAFYLLTSRAWELGMGVALAIFEVEGRRLPALQTGLANNIEASIGLILVVAPFFLLSSQTAFPGLAALPSVAGTALLLSSSGSWVNRKFLSLPPLVFVGRVSYSFYLIHWPLLTFLRILSGKTLPETWSLAAIAIAFGLAVLSYYFVERPFRSTKLGAGPLLWRYGAVSLALLLVSGTIYAAKGIPWRYPSVAAIDEAADTAAGPSHDICLAQAGTSAPNLAETCAGGQSVGPHIALWGDSHASALASALRPAAAQQGYFMEEYAKTSCPPLYGAGRSYRRNPAELGECIRFNGAVLHRLVAEPQVQVVLLDALWDGSFDPRYTDAGKLAVAGHDPASHPSQAETKALLDSSMRATVQALLAAHKQVIVFNDIPGFEIDPIWRMRTSQIPLRSKLSNLLNRGAGGVDSGVDRAYDDTPEQIAGRRQLQQTILSVPRVSLWDARSHLCSEGGLCVYREGQTPLFLDTNHLSPEGASRVLQGLQIHTR
jgi:peptidoglycan/LPS O-acetylase OafA/YrhL